jgi:hypothetical protein
MDSTCNLERFVSSREASGGSAGQTTEKIFPFHFGLRTIHHEIRPAILWFTGFGAP